MKSPTTKMKKVLLLILYFQELTSTPMTRQKTVLTYHLPDKRYLKKALGYDEDTYLNFTELTSKYKYPSEEHKIITEDGYILRVFRILPKCANTPKMLPVILMHGINDSSDSWIVNGPQTGLGYILSDNCFDVWAANHRGNVYSRRHTKLDPDRDYEFWNYSFDENGNYDIPSIIDYVTQITSQSKVFYIGHSEGTTDFFTAMSLRPEYNNKIQLSINLAPVAWLKHLNNPIPRFFAQRTSEVKSFLDSFGIGELFAKEQLTHEIIEFLCQFAPELFCGTGLTLTTGYVKGSIMPRTLAVVFGHLLVGVSGKTLAHFGQLILSKKFQRYDEGKEGNMRRYGVTKPPIYNVTKIVAPVVLICGRNDLVSSLKDVDELSSRLPNVVEKYIVPNSKWSHNNHVWGVEAPNLVFRKILDYLNRYKT